MMDEVQKALVFLLANPSFGGVFYAEFYARCRRIEGPDVLPPGALMAVTVHNGRPTLLTNLEVLKGMTTQQIARGLMHEALHVLMEHAKRACGRDHKAWNIAGDLAINSIIPDMDIGLIPGVGDFLHFPRGRSAEEYYDMLCKNTSKGGAGEGPCSCGSPAATEVMPDFDRDVIKEAVKSAAAVTGAKNMSRGAAGLEILINEFLNKGTVDWRAVLRRCIAASINAGKRSTWLRPNRKKLPMQGRLRTKMPKLAVAIDTSGSIASDPKLLKSFAEEIQSLMRTYRSDVQVLECDAAIVGEYKIHPGGRMNLKVHGGGGTSFAPVYEWFKENKQRPDVLVYLTDLMGEFPKVGSVKTLWCVPVKYVQKDTEVPFGRIIPMQEDK